VSPFRLSPPASSRWLVALDVGAYVTPARVRMLSAGAAGCLGGALLVLGVLVDHRCGPLSVLCLTWLAVLVWLEEA
jgi:hypothetical protein